MPAAGTVDVTSLVAPALVTRRARGRIHGRNRKNMFLNFAVGECVVQVAVVKVIDMPVVLNCSVATIRSVLVRMIRVNLVCHGLFLRLGEAVKDLGS